MPDISNILIGRVFSGAALSVEERDIVSVIGVFDGILPKKQRHNERMASGAFKQWDSKDSDAPNELVNLPKTAIFSHNDLYGSVLFVNSVSNNYCGNGVPGLNRDKKPKDETKPATQYGIIKTTSRYLTREYGVFLSGSKNSAPIKDNYIKKRYSRKNYKPINTSYKEYNRSKSELDSLTGN